MDRRQTVVQRACEFFGDRLDDVLHMVREDRQVMARLAGAGHVRAARRRAPSPRTAATHDGDRGESVRGQRHRRQPGQLRVRPRRGRAGSRPAARGHRPAAGVRRPALEKLTRNAFDLNTEEAFGLEAVLLVYGRPALLVSQGRLASVPPFWNLIEDQREDVEGGPARCWPHRTAWPSRTGLGRHWLPRQRQRAADHASPRCSARTRTIAGSSVPASPPGWTTARPTRTSARPATASATSLAFTMSTIWRCWKSRRANQRSGASAAEPGGHAAVPHGRQAGLPDRLPGAQRARTESEAISPSSVTSTTSSRQPGLLRGEFSFSEARFLRHDCAPLGNNSGALDSGPGDASGARPATGGPLPRSVHGSADVRAARRSALQERQRPLYRGDAAAGTRPRHPSTRRLARSRNWAEARNTIDNLYRRTFGNTL